MHFILAILLSIVFLSFDTALKAESLVDLEERVQDFVLETKQIHIPGYPHAFNASIVRWNGSLLMSFRTIPDPKSAFTCYMGVVWLDDDFNIISEPQLLDFRNEYICSPSRAEDGRLLVVNDHLYIVYDDNIDMNITKGGFRVFVAELVLEGPIIAVKNIECLSKFEGESPDRREKAWVPFDYCGNLLLAYSLNPHLIFYPMLGTGECVTLTSNEAEIPWIWGELRGGTQGYQIDDGRYLSFFHSSTLMQTAHSNGKMILHYFIGAYTFCTEPPFAITHISPEPIIGKHFYNGPIYKHYWKPIRAVFPCGFIFDDNYIWISYGRDDHEIWIVKIDKEGLLQSLVPV